MESKIPVAILAATGAVGQRFVQLLDGHPWFEVTALTGSDRRVGARYGETCRWVLPEPMPDWASEMPVLPSIPEAVGVPLVFSALPSQYAGEIEADFARSGAAVCSNASVYRTDPLVPLLLPEVNADHTALVTPQRTKYNWDGLIATNPNCTSTGLTITLKILDDAFGVRSAFAVSLQAISGAGYPGVPSLDMIDNVIPYIAGEEEKVAWEPRKMMGTAAPDGVRLHPIEMSVHVTRVPVIDGHTVCLSVSLETPASPDLVRQALFDYIPPAAARNLPSTPQPVIAIREEPDRPQPRLDRLAGGGMTTVVGRIRPDPLLDVKMVVLSHNTIRGAAGGSIYNAELLVSQDFVKS